MLATVNVGNLLEEILLGWSPAGDDPAIVIGDSRVAYLFQKDPGDIFIEAAAWHDAAYTAGSSAQKEMHRWEVDKHLLEMMLAIAHSDRELIKEALTLYMFVRVYGSAWWDNKETND